MNTSIPAFEYWNAGSDAYKQLLAVKQTLAESKVSDQLLELIYLLVSQMNGCQFCIGVHQAAAGRAGASEQQIYDLKNWRDSTVFNDLERAAFERAEDVTLMTRRYEETQASLFLQTRLSDQELTDLTVAICLINAMNRLAISFRRKR